MTTRTCHRRRSLQTPPCGRRGVVVGLLMVMLVFLTGFVALGVNVIRLRQLQTQMHNACQAAALAAAAHLLDEHSLYATPHAGDDLVEARVAAGSYARSHQVDGQSLEIDPNPTNHPAGDLVVGWVDPAGPVAQPLSLPDAERPRDVNTVRVTTNLDRNVADKVTIWFGGLVGLSTGDVDVSAQASLDRRIVGFRPEPGVKVPVSPLIAEQGPWLEQAAAAADPERNDLYAVNPATGEVTARSDGIPEITVVYAPAPATAKANAADENNATEANAESVQPARCAPLRLVNDENLSYIWPVRAREGLSLGDLSAYGGALIVENGATPVGVESALPDELPYGMMDVLGQVRAWPLGAPTGSSWNLTGFAAARVVAVRRTDGALSPTWTFVLQPATLVSSQAVADVAGAMNPWIAKLELTQ